MLKGIRQKLSKKKAPNQDSVDVNLEQMSTQPQDTLEQSSIVTIPEPAFVMLPISSPDSISLNFDPTNMRVFAGDHTSNDPIVTEFRDSNCSTVAGEPGDSNNSTMIHPYDPNNPEIIQSVSSDSSSSSMSQSIDSKYSTYSSSDARSTDADQSSTPEEAGQAHSEDPENPDGELNLGDLEKEIGVDDTEMEDPPNNMAIAFKDPEVFLPDGEYKIKVYTCAREGAAEKLGTDLEGIQDLLEENEICIPSYAIKDYLAHPQFRVDSFSVEEDDPKKWPHKKKLLHTVMYGVTTLVSQYSSAAMAPIIGEIQNAFGVRFKVAILGTCLYILGIAFGPMLFAPLSEVYGRKVSTLGPFVVAGCFTFAAACSYNIFALLLFRFLAGIFSAAPIVIGGGMLADIWDPDVRGNYLAIYSNFVTLGPCISPLIGGGLLRVADWRSLMFFTSGLYFLIFIINSYLLSESYRSVLLAREAKNLRIKTGNWLFHAELDEWEFTFAEFIHKHVKRPLKMMITPIIFFVAGYASFVFGVFYLVAISVSFTFQELKGWAPIVSGVPMLAMYLGASCIGIPVNILSGIRYRQLLAIRKDKSMPEERLHAVMFLGAILPAGIFLFGFTVNVTLATWIPPCLGLAMMGAGFFIIFQGCLNYLVDAYPQYSASAIAVSTCLRSIFAGSFPLFSREIFNKTSIEMGCLSVALLATACLPIPFWLYAKGKELRAKYVFD